MGVHAAEQYARRDSMSSGGSCKQMMSVVSGGVELRIERTTSGDRWQFRDIVLNSRSVVVISGLWYPHWVWAHVGWGSEVWGGVFGLVQDSLGLCHFRGACLVNGVVFTSTVGALGCNVVAEADISAFRRPCALARGHEVR